jgi:hypothetical protein
MAIETFALKTCLYRKLEQANVWSKLNGAGSVAATYTNMRQVCTDKGLHYLEPKSYSL